MTVCQKWLSWIPACARMTTFSKTQWLKFLIFLITTTALADVSKAASQVSIPSNESGSKENIAMFYQTWQCKNCNLTQIDFSNFSSQSPDSKHSMPANCSEELVLSGANLSGCKFTKANFMACMRGVTTPFRQIDFSYANLSGADLNDSVFYGVSFFYSNLPDAQLNYAKLDLSNFTQANFSHAHLKGAQSEKDAMHGWGSNFYLANFCGADLSQAKLYGYFRGANFCKARLIHATLSSSDGTIPPGIPELQKHTGQGLWAGINFADADLTGAHFYGGDGQPADISQARFCRTLMPNGSINNRDC